MRVSKSGVQGGGLVDRGNGLADNLASNNGKRGEIIGKAKVDGNFWIVKLDGAMQTCCIDAGQLAPADEQSELNLEAEAS